LSTNENRVALIQDVLNEIGRNKIAPALEAFEVHLILDEAITNGMEHGNLWNPDKELLVELYHDKTFLYLYVRDQGRGFDKKIILERLRKPPDLSPRGRGIVIMHNFSQLEWNESGNELVLQLKIAN